MATRAATLERTRLGEVPVLIAAAGAREIAAARGTVLVYHPLGADKSLHADDLARLAAAGFLAVGVDAIAHGERRTADAYERFRADPFGVLLEVVTSTATEVPAILDALEARGWAVPGRVAIVGVSLGGFVAYGAAASEPRLAAAVCITASPEWGEDPRSPHLRVDRFYPLALLSIVAAADPVIPPEHARALHAALAPRYAAAPERLRLVELPGAVHRMAPADRDRVRAEAERWLARWIPPREPEA